MAGSQPGANKEGRQDRGGEGAGQGNPSSQNHLTEIKKKKNTVGSPGTAAPSGSVKVLCANFPQGKLGGIARAVKKVKKKSQSRALALTYAHRPPTVSFANALGERA